jgi:phenylalanyl-tRNA synthetase beta chain
MASRLALAGMRSISLVVDITNYVMLELGQPLHAYDRDKLDGGITVRRAAVGETMVTLDGQERKLSTEDLLIADESGPIGIAGVMGGERTEIDLDSTRVLIEAAGFDPVSIARSARRHKLPSEASKRFERGVDPLVSRYAAARVVQLLVELAGGTAIELGSTLVEATLPAPIALPNGYVDSIIGTHFTAAEVHDSLTMIGATIADAPDSAALIVTPPSWRPDLIDKPHLAEEVARIVGYDRIPSVLPVAPPGRGLTRSQRLRRAAANGLAAFGLTEVLAYPFVSRAAIERFGDTPGQAIALANPLDAEAGFLRTSLIPGLVDIARRNLSRGLTDLALFELGTVFLPTDDVLGTATVPPGPERPSEALLAELNASLPEQPWHVAAMFLGNAVDKQPGHAAKAAGLADALAAVKQLAASVGARIDVATGSHRSLHPGRTAELSVSGTVIGVAGELLPALALELDLPRVVAVVEIDLDALIALAPAEVTPTPIASLPAATQDLSLIVDAGVPAGDVLAAVIEGAGALLEHARLVDDYRGAGVPEGSKSLTFALRFRAPDRTLTAPEASEAKRAGAALAASRFGATTRE